MSGFQIVVNVSSGSPIVEIEFLVMMLLLSGKVTQHV